MVHLSYGVHNCDDLISWLVHSLGSEAILLLVVCGLLFLVHVLYSILSLLDKLGRRVCRCANRSCSYLEAYLRSQYSNSSFRDHTIRPPRTLVVTLPTQASLQCYDRPDCPLPSPSSLGDPSPAQSVSDAHRTSSTPLDGNPLVATPVIPLAPPPPCLSRNPQRRRRSIT